MATGSRIPSAYGIFLFLVLLKHAVGVAVSVSKLQLPTIGQFVALLYMFVLKLLLGTMFAELIGWNYTGQDFILSSNDHLLQKSKPVSLVKELRDIPSTTSPKGTSIPSFDAKDLQSLDSMLVKFAELSEETPDSEHWLLSTVGSILNLILSFESKDCLSRMVCSFAAGTNIKERKYVFNLHRMASRISSQVPRILRYVMAINLGLSSGSLAICKSAFPKCKENIDLISQGIIGKLKR